jgi:hypothetical protein
MGGIDIHTKSVKIVGLRPAKSIAFHMSVRATQVHVKLLRLRGSRMGQKGADRSPAHHQPSLGGLEEWRLTLVADSNRSGNGAAIASEAMKSGGGLGVERWSCSRFSIDYFMGRCG